MNDETTKSTNDNVKVESNSSFIEFSKYIPIVYPIFVFLGYINYDFYYRKFNIDIFNYLSINEFLFSFISLIYPIIFLFVSYLSMNAYNEFMIGDIKLKKRKNEDDQKEKKDKENHIENYELKKSIFISKYKKAKQDWNKGKHLKAIGNYVLMVLLFLLFIITIFLPTFILWYGFTIIILPLYSITSLKIKEPSYLNEPRLLVTVILICFIAVGVVLGIRHLKGKMTKKSFRFYLIAIFFIVIISTLMQYQNLRSYNFIHQKATKELCFVYENQNIETTENKRLLGITADYIFLRDHELKTNYIYKLSEVRYLEILHLERD
ncbi:hypothetical protein [uncultured Psychroserpens sp.]|uniref:hypothetical protein n=1 Tax=uncultured Psychroserpens sp. TaxID=255436 RepID=UPI002617C3EB|nr:hypothetical protein [uncultured Psychroserpens sp.]